MLHPWGLLRRLADVLLTHFDKKKNWTDWQVNWLTEAAPTMIEDATMNREMHDNDSENYASLSHWMWASKMSNTIQCMLHRLVPIFNL